MYDIGTHDQDGKLATEILKKEDKQANIDAVTEKQQIKEDNILSQYTTLIHSGGQSQKKITEFTFSSKGQVAKELKRLQERFALLVSRIISRLEETTTNEYELKELARRVGVLLLEEKDLDKLTKVTTIDMLFDEIKPHFSFLNCELIESIVDSFLTGSDLENELTNYLEELEAFQEVAQLQHFKAAIDEALIDLPKQETTETTCEVIIKLQGRCGQMTLQNFNKLINYLFPTKKHYLSHIHIEPGSICVRLLAPCSRCHSLILMAAEKTTFMHHVGIFEMIINNHHILMEEEDATFTFEQTLLQAAQAGQNNDVTLLLELGVNTDYQDEEGQTGLMLATNGEHEQVVQTLISVGAKVDIQDNNGYTALTIACKNNSYKIVDLLLQAQGNPNIQTQGGCTALILSRDHGRGHGRGHGHYQDGHYQDRASAAELLLKINDDLW